MNPRVAMPLAALLLATAARAADAPAFDPATLVATYGAEQGPAADPRIIAITTLQLHADHTVTLRRFAQAPDMKLDNLTPGTWTYAAGTLTLTFKDATGAAQTFDFAIIQEGRILSNTTQNGHPLTPSNPGLGVLMRDFSSPKLPPASAPASAPQTTPSSAPATQPA